MSETLALVQANSLGLSHVAYFLDQVSDEQYKTPSLWLMGGSPGAHIRHTLEFYLCLLSGLGKGSINYDLRERNPDLENYRLIAQEKVKMIVDQINTIHTDAPITLIAEGDSGQWISVPSCVHRELVYAMEHLTHHLAILRIFMLIAFPEIQFPENFGVAHSTLTHRNKVCVQ